MNKDKIIFLDIDGVLNPTHFMNALFKMWRSSGKKIKSRDKYGQLFFDQNCEALARIIEQTGSKIVVSSTWRLAGIDVMLEMWDSRKLAGEIIGVTPTGGDVAKELGCPRDDVSRGMEIACWIKRNNYIGNYAIIDDDNVFLPYQERYLVKTNGYVGLTVNDAQLAVEILNMPQKPITT